MENTETPSLYEHVKRPEWGLAILNWQNDNKRCFQFQDGKMRIFGKGYYDMLAPVDRPLDIALEIVEELEEKCDIAKAKKRRGQRLREKGRYLISFDDQLAVFKHTYAEGFASPEYANKVRGEGAAKRRNGHRNAIIADAEEVLAQAELEKLIEAGEFLEMYQRLLQVMKRSDLISSTRDRKPMENLPEESRKDVCEALYGLLYGEGQFDVRFKRWLTTLQRVLVGEPSWSLSTFFQAVRFPQEYVCVKPSVFRDEASWSAPRMVFSNTPKATLYDRLCEMAVNVRTRLNEVGLTPRDLLDVHEFIWTTRRPKALTTLKSLK